MSSRGPGAGRGLGGRALAAEDKRERLLDAAEAAFCRHGYERTTIGVLAAEAGVTRPTVYAYFASKDDVFRALASRVRDEFLALQESASTESPARTVREALAAFVGVYGRHYALLTVLAHQALVDPDLRALHDDIFARVELRNTRFLERLQREGLAAPVVPPADLSRAIFGVAHRSAEAVRQDPGQEPRLVEQLVTLYLVTAGIADPQRRSNDG